VFDDDRDKVLGARHRPSHPGYLTTAIIEVRRRRGAGWRERVKYWIDTEFIARPYSIDLISIGLVAEDGREFYAESSEVDWSKANPWTLENVRPQLDGKGIGRIEIGYGVREFTDHDKAPVFWGYFPSYDWAAFVWLFGSLDELPFHYPQLCLDIKQWAIELGDPELPHQKGARHHALHDARWTKEAWMFLAGLHPGGSERRCVGRKNPDQ
jgi:3' exoribonuclease, RNase T-like